MKVTTVSNVGNMADKRKKGFEAILSTSLPNGYEAKFFTSGLAFNLVNDYWTIRCNNEDVAKFWLHGRSNRISVKNADSAEALNYLIFRWGGMLEFDEVIVEVE
jgi:hypothetical protein